MERQWLEIIWRSTNLNKFMLIILFNRLVCRSLCAFANSDSTIFPFDVCANSVNLGIVLYTVGFSIGQLFCEVFLNIKKNTNKYWLIYQCPLVPLYSQSIKRLVFNDAVC